MGEGRDLAPDPDPLSSPPPDLQLARLASLHACAFSAVGGQWGRQCRRSDTVMAPTLIPGLPKNFDPSLLHVLRPRSLPP